jgi:ribosomal protein S18 acetylase RimI-like enzyme
MTVTYRTPCADEATALAALGRETFCETFAHLYQAEDLNAFLEQVYAPASLAADLANPNRLFQVAEDDGKLIGYCKLGLDVSLDYDPAGRHVIELKQLYLMPGHHGTGIAAHLMDWALAAAERLGADDMILSVWSGNDRAQRFYKRYGFDWVADTYFMVGEHRDDEFLYLKKLR